MHKLVYAFTYYLMNNILPLFIKYFDNPLITFQNLNHNLQTFFYCRFWKTTRVIFLYVAEMHGKQWICMFQFVHSFVMKILNYFGGIYCIPTNTTKGKLTILFSYMNKGNNKITELRTILQRDAQIEAYIFIACRAFQSHKEI